jgi:SAM-dependent methyltransferase
VDLRTLTRAYDRSAASYDERFRALQRPKYRAAALLLEQAGFLSRPLPPDALVLDAGAGTALFAEWLRDGAEPHGELRARLCSVLERGRLVTLDLSVEMLRRARPRTGVAVAADLARPPLRRESCELVVSFTALLENVPQSLRALGALVRPGGLLCASFLQRESPAPDALARWSGLLPTLPPLAAGQDLVHVVGQQPIAMRQG